MKLDEISNLVVVGCAAVAILFEDFRAAMYAPWVIGLTILLVLLIIATVLVHQLLSTDVFAVYPDEQQPEKPELTEAETTVNNLLAMGRRVSVDRVQGGGE